MAADLPRYLAVGTTASFRRLAVQTHRYSMHDLSRLPLIIALLYPSLVLRLTLRTCCATQLTSSSVADRARSHGDGARSFALS